MKLTRIVAVLLVSCLIADPATASAMSKPSFIRTSISPQTTALFQEAALSRALDWTHQSLFGTAKHNFSIRRTAETVYRLHVAPWTLGASPAEVQQRYPHQLRFIEKSREALSWVYLVGIPLVFYSILWKHSPVSYVGRTFVLLGGILWFTGYATLRPHMGVGRVPTKPLFVSWIYRYMRHPMYMANILFGLGFLLMSHSYVLIGWYVAAVVSFIQFAAEEEMHLWQEFGSEYLEYAGRVAMFPFLPTPLVKSAAAPGRSSGMVRPEISGMEEVREPYMGRGEQVGGSQIDRRLAGGFVRSANFADSGSPKIGPSAAAPPINLLQGHLRDTLVVRDMRTGKMTTLRYVRADLLTPNERTRVLQSCQQWEEEHDADVLSLMQSLKASNASTRLGKFYLALSSDDEIEGYVSWGSDYLAWMELRGDNIDHTRFKGVGAELLVASFLNSQATDKKNSAGLRLSQPVDKTREILKTLLGKIRTKTSPDYDPDAEDSAMEDWQDVLVNGAEVRRAVAAQNKLVQSLIAKYGWQEQHAAKTAASAPDDLAAAPEKANPLAVAPGFWWGKLYQAAQTSQAAVWRWLEDPANRDHVLELAQDYPDAYRAARYGDLAGLRRHIESGMGNRGTAPVKETEMLKPLALEAFIRLDPTVGIGVALTSEIVKTVFDPLRALMKGWHDSFFVKDAAGLFSKDDSPEIHARLMDSIDTLFDGLERNFVGYQFANSLLFKSAFTLAWSLFTNEHSIANLASVPGNGLMIASVAAPTPAQAFRRFEFLGESVLRKWDKGGAPGPWIILFDVDHAHIRPNLTEELPKVNAILFEEWTPLRGEIFKTEKAKGFPTLEEGFGSLGMPLSSASMQDNLVRVQNRVRHELGMTISFSAVRYQDLFSASEALGLGSLEQREFSRYLNTDGERAPQPILQETIHDVLWELMAKAKRKGGNHSLIWEPAAPASVSAGTAPEQRKQGPGAAPDKIEEDGPSISIGWVDGQWQQVTLTPAQHSVLNKTIGDLWHSSQRLERGDPIYDDVARSLRNAGKRPLTILVPSDESFYSSLRHHAQQFGTRFPKQYRLVTHPGTNRDGRALSWNLVIPEHELLLLRDMRSRKSRRPAYEQWLQHEIAHLMHRNSNEAVITRRNPIDEFLEVHTSRVFFHALGNLTRIIRDAEGWTQDDLAKKMDVVRHYVNKIEYAKQSLTLQSFIRLAKALGIPAAILMDLLHDFPAPHFVQLPHTAA